MIGKHTFTHGMEVKAIYMPSDGGGWQVGSRGVSRIVVSMEYGQMAGVPWFNVWTANDAHLMAKVNAAAVEFVEFPEVVA